MPTTPGIPDTPGGGSRAERAAQLKAQMDAKKAEAQAKAGAVKQAGGAEFHHVQSGETLESIAEQHGQSPEAIWNHPLNKQLRDRVGSPEELGLHGRRLEVNRVRSVIDRAQGIMGSVILPRPRCHGPQGRSGRRLGLWCYIQEDNLCHPQHA